MYSQALATGECVKKCASCSKDLPEAALHCVFCGAKQAPAPAVGPSVVAKTAFGYSANEVMQQLGNQRPQSPQQPAPQQPAPQQPYQRHPPSQQPLAPSSSPHAPTVMVSPGGGPPPPQQYNPQPYNPPAQQPYNPPAQQYNVPPQQQYGYGGGGPQPLGIHSPQQGTPQPIPAAPTPYLGAQTGAASARPIEPWRSSLKLMMIVWGAVLLAAFATPMSTDPMIFNWDAIIHAPGTAKVVPLVWAAAGLLSLVLGAIPLAALPRGVLALVLGLAGIFVPMALHPESFSEWKHLVPLVGGLLLVPGLLVRNEYTHSLLSRVLVTIGVVCLLVPYLIPEGGQIPLVMIFKGLIEAPGEAKIQPILMLGEIVLVVMCLLAWMPGPATAAAKIFAWAVLLYPVLVFVVYLLVKGGIGDIVSKTPGALMAWAQPVAYAVLIGYGAATVFGKQLE